MAQKTAPGGPRCGEGERWSGHGDSRPGTTQPRLRRFRRGFDTDGACWSWWAGTEALADPFRCTATL